jgi:hypothetical protein
MAMRRLIFAAPEATLARKRDRSIFAEFAGNSGYSAKVETGFANRIRARQALLGGF